MKDLLEYRAQLASKLNAVDDILRDMGIPANPSAVHKIKAAQGPMSAAIKKKISASKKKWWAARKDGGQAPKVSGHGK